MQLNESAGVRPRWSPEWLRGKGIAIALLAAAVVFGRAALAAEDRHPLEPADTSSPRATLHSFIDSCNVVYRAIQAMERGDPRIKRYEHVVDRILRCLDLSQQPAYMREYIGGETAVCLKEILDRIELPPDDQIPDAGTGGNAAGAGAPARWRIPYTDIVIAKMQEGPRRGEYLFTSETVERASGFYERVKHLPYRTKGPEVSEGFYHWFLSEPRSSIVAALVHRLPDWMHKRVYGQAIWQWVGLVTSLGLALFVMFAAYRMGRWQAERIRKAGVIRYCLTLAFPIAAMLVPIVARDFIAGALVISGTTLAVVKFSANVVFLLAVLVVLAGVGSRIAEIIISSPRIHPKGIDAQLIRLTCRVLSLAAAVIVFLEGGKYLGIPLTTLLAGAGVGGLAVALAAQDTLKNLFGSMMIILDKPYRVGERIVVKGYDGVVEEIGLRSTKIRLLTGHQAAIPNDEMARCDVENIGRRPYIRRIADIALPLDTPPDKLEKALEIVRRLVQDHEGMEPDFPPRVYLNEYNRDSLNLRIIYWYHPPNYWDFLAFSEKFNLQLKREFEAAGVRFALPSATTYLAAGVEGFPPGGPTTQVDHHGPPSPEHTSLDDSAE